MLNILPVQNKNLIPFYTLAVFRCSKSGMTVTEIQLCSKLICNLSILRWFAQSWRLKTILTKTLITPPKTRILENWFHALLHGKISGPVTVGGLYPRTKGSITPQPFRHKKDKLTWHKDVAQSASVGRKGFLDMLPFKWDLRDKQSREVRPVLRPRR